MDTETARAIDTLRKDLGRLEARLEARMRDGFAENRRHLEVITESLSDDIRILAEGFASLNTKVDALLPPQRRQ
jgi:hypothetical protein